jgi:methylmalonyl-CoA/ethylmalonyl-CoA epimerase
MRRPTHAFDHVGIVTDDVESLAELYHDLFGLHVAHREEFDGIQVSFLQFGEGYFELLEPIEHETLERALDRRGTGMHHVALATDDIDASLDAARDAGAQCIDETAREGAWGHDVAFLHPESTGGVLFEFVEH